MKSVSVAVVTLACTHQARGLFRYKAAHPNTAGLKGSTSFRPPYLIHESSDMSGKGDEGTRTRFYAILAKMGYMV